MAKNTVCIQPVPLFYREHSPRRRRCLKPQREQKPVLEHLKHTVTATVAAQGVTINSEHQFHFSFRTISWIGYSFLLYILLKLA